MCHFVCASLDFDEVLSCYLRGHVAVADQRQCSRIASKNQLQFFRAAFVLRVTESRWPNFGLLLPLASTAGALMYAQCFVFPLIPGFSCGRRRKVAPQTPGGDAICSRLSRLGLGQRGCGCVFACSQRRRRGRGRGRRLPPVCVCSHG